MKERLDKLVFEQGLATTRSQAENMVRLGSIKVNNKVIRKPGLYVTPDANITSVTTERYVSRAGLKLASVANSLRLNFASKNILDVGSSTGGFTDYALQHGAKKVFAVDVGTNQLHPSLRTNPKITLHEQTNILDVRCSKFDVKKNTKSEHQNSTIYIQDVPDIIVIDVSFVSLRELLPHIAKHLAGKKTEIVAMVKPQFESRNIAKHSGVIKNNTVRRTILQDFEVWAKQYFVILQKADSAVKGAKGNQERFYLLKIQKLIDKN